MVALTVMYGSKGQIMIDKDFSLFALVRSTLPGNLEKRQAVALH